MTIDERLEALTMNLELLSREGESQRQRIELLSREGESQRRRIESLVGLTDSLVGLTGSLTKAIQQDAENIRALVRVAEIHDRRLTRLEGATEQ